MDGTWWLFFRSEVPLDLETLATALSGIEGAKVASNGEMLRVDLGAHSFDVGLDAAPSIAHESKTLAEAHAALHRDKAKIAKCDRRFVIHYELALGRAAANALIAIETALASLVERAGEKTFAYNPKTNEFF